MPQILAAHKVAQLRRPLIGVGAGLPQIGGLAGRSKSHAERLFDYPTVGALKPVDATKALEQPVADLQVACDSAALDRLVEVTRGDRYFLQHRGYDVGNPAVRSPITLDDVTVATQQAIGALDESFFRVRFDRCMPPEKRYMRALADLGEGPKRSGDVAERLSLKVTRIGPTRSKLITKGMIYSRRHGETAFTVTLCDGCMPRAQPADDWKR